MDSTRRQPFVRDGPSVTSSSVERIVVDASAVVELLLGGARAQAVRQVIGVASPAAPDLLNAEAISAFRRFEAAGVVGARRAWEAIALLADAPIERLTTAQLSLDVWRLRHNLSSHDATYVALAVALDCPLLTADHGITQAPDIGIPVVTV